MPLQQLVEYFNDRLEEEHRNGFRPFVLRDGLIHGVFGPLEITTALSPIRQTLSTSQIAGHAAYLHVATRHTPLIQPSEVENLLSPAAYVANSADSIIQFDRLSRTVHMLNYLPQAHREELFFLEVDPRHILGIQEDHGAYFEEVIQKCGLETSRVVIVLPINTLYSRFYSYLLKGLHNYQRRGYRLALKFDYHTLEKSTLELITKAGVDFVALSSWHLDSILDNQLLNKLQHITQQVKSVDGRSLMLNVNDKRNAVLARQTGFDLVQGNYFEQPAHSQQPFVVKAYPTHNRPAVNVHRVAG